MRNAHVPLAPAYRHAPDDPFVAGGPSLLGPLLIHEAAEFRSVVRAVPRPSMARCLYQGLIALSRPPTLWLKWLLQGVPARGLPAVGRSELLDRAIRLARDREAAAGPGLWLEFGVFRGDSLRRIAAGAPSPVVGFDSFEGLPSAWGPGHPRGKFATGNAVPLPPPNSRFVAGLFDATLPPFLNAHSEARASFVHVDCDLYHSTRVVLEGLTGRLREGTVIVFDEFCGLLPDDEARAFREFLRASRLGFRFVGVSFEGAVAVELVPPGGRLLPSRERSPPRVVDEHGSPPPGEAMWGGVAPEPVSALPGLPDVS